MSSSQSLDHVFGSSRCFAHELNVDLNCIVPENGNTSSIPDYCSRSWCYVDALKCMASYERVYRSQLFSVDSGVDVVSINMINHVKK